MNSPILPVMIAFLLAHAQDPAARNPTVCRHAAAGDARSFDAKDLGRRWERALRFSARQPAEINLRARPSAHEAPAYSAYLRAFGGARGALKPPKDLPADWAGKTFVFASAGRARTARLPPDAALVLTGWKSNKELKDALDAAGNRRVLVATADIARLLGVTADETLVRVVSTRDVRLEPVR